MTGTEEKKSKKFAVGGGDLPPSPTSSATLTTTTTNKRPTRHHVKRRSSGRVHVSKLAPMARAHSNTNLEAEDEVKKPMKRSQSNKSLTKLTLSTTTTPNEPKLSMMTPVIPTPVEEVQVKAPSSPPKTPTLPVQKKPLLKSQFVDANQQQQQQQQQQKKLGNVASVAATQQPTGMTRTQQKLLLQREQSLIHDENNIAHPKNMIRLTREMEKMGKEYRCVRKYQDPMMESLKRCQQAKSKPSLHTRTFSSSFIAQPALPHMEQRRQILLKTALQHQQANPKEDTNENNNKWSPSQFLDRLFFGNA
ncbi:hypothetical protein INT47_007849 [Mucor saturninus]|uniref:Uncharacterized protein n=1 Tax=Mucor saturninus TaxID=64648 RepID=A0A8H7RDZ7_9FUNG|nr:hypothetical protein INT47_007849 [Mucor saturninus]